MRAREDTSGRGASTPCTASEALSGAGAAEALDFLALTARALRALVAPRHAGPRLIAAPATHLSAGAVLVAGAGRRVVAGGRGTCGAGRLALRLAARRRCRRGRWCRGRSRRRAG